MKKIHLDNKILSGLTDVLNSDSDGDCSSPKQDRSQEQKTGSKHVLISLFGKDKYEQGNIDDSKSVSNPAIYIIKDILAPNELDQRELYTERALKLVLGHFQKYGTIQEIRFTGHGVSGKMGDTDNQPFVINWFLDKLAHQEHLHGKIANRIVFDGCNTFSGINDYAIAYYSSYAQTNHTQLVGATSTIVGIFNYYGTHFHVGRYVQFSPDGKIIRDVLDSRFNPFTLMAENDRSWTDFYIGHTAEEGAAIKKIYEAEEKKEQKQLKWLKKGERNIF